MFAIERHQRWPINFNTKGHVYGAILGQERAAKIEKAMIVAVKHGEKHDQAKMKRMKTGILSSFFL